MKFQCFELHIIDFSIYRKVGCAVSVTFTFNHAGISSSSLPKNLPDKHLKYYGGVLITYFFNCLVQELLPFLLKGVSNIDRHLAQF